MNDCQNGCTYWIVILSKCISCMVLGRLFIALSPLFLFPCTHEPILTTFKTQARQCTLFVQIAKCIFPNKKNIHHQISMLGKAVSHLEIHSQVDNFILLFWTVSHLLVLADPTTHLPPSLSKVKIFWTPLPKLCELQVYSLGDLGRRS